MDWEMLIIGIVIGLAPSILIPQIVRRFKPKKDEKVASIIYTKDGRKRKVYYE